MQIFILILYLSNSFKLFTIIPMVRNIKFLAFFIGLMYSSSTLATTSPSNYISANTYNNLYPYMNNTMKTNLNPGTNPTQSNAQINVLTRTKTNNSNTRNVVPRTNARVATTTLSSANVPTRNVSSSTNTSTTSTRANTSTRNNSSQTTTTQRNVVARSGTSTIKMKAATTTRSSRGDASTSSNLTSSGSVTYNSTTQSIPSSRCMADYIECMNGYCERENSAYNRCYCSSKLAQIDSQYQTEIDNLIKEIIKLQGTNNWSEDEMNEYWMEIIGTHTGDNSWVNLENALDIDWASTESRVRGQQAFTIGHEYCVQHLKGCAYMANNMRDAYRSEISRDCATYESSLLRIKNAAESIVESYK